MKFALSLCLVALSFSAMAGEERLIAKCRDVGVKKVIMQAHAFNMEVDLSTIRDCGTSTNIFAKYVWFCGTAYDQNGNQEEIKQITQKAPFKACCDYHSKMTY